MLGLLGAAAALVAAAGCADPQRAGVTAESPAKAAASSPQAIEPPSSRAERPAALLDGSVITWDDLRPMLAEASGGVVLQEAALDRLLEREMQDRKQSVTPEDVAAERKLLLDVIVREAKASPNDAERLLEQVRRTRGLGAVRFQHLLERNARMRKIVAGQVSVSEAEISQAFEMLHGTKYRVRVLVVPTQTQASEIRQQLVDSTGDLASRFGAAAAKTSTDPSAARGGLLLDPMSPADPAYPASVREAVQKLQAGQMSDVVAVDRGFALVLLEEVLPADGTTLSAATPAIREEVLSRRERVAMDDLARRLLQQAHLTAMDRDLDWSLKAGQQATP